MSIKSFFSLIKKFLCPPSQFMSMNPAYSKYSVGSWSYGFPKVYDSGSGAKLSIGKYCGFGEEVMILLSDEHNTRSVSSYPFNTFWGTERPWSKGNIEIGNDVWVGNRATIMSGVIIGDGAVIGAGAVVAKDVPAYAVAVGNPAQVVKYRFSQETIDYLLKLQWWKWNHKKVMDNREFLTNKQYKEETFQMLNNERMKNYRDKIRKIKYSPRLTTSTETVGDEKK